MANDRIQKLPTHVVHQIAAGEIIERPANLVKELIENSLDASAKRIRIEIDHGGRVLRVEDDGHGILPEDLILALTPHATSKITQLGDLNCLDTYGFRGEALATAAAVGELRLSSRFVDCEQAFCIESRFGEICGHIQESTQPRGTEVVVSDLFGNTPARLKFLKSPGSEYNAIRSVVKSQALIRPDVEFQLLIGGKLEEHWPSRSEAAERIFDVLGVELYELAAQSQGMQLKLWFSDPSQTLRQAKNLWFFVNRRWIQDARLRAAVLTAYRSLLMHGEYPTVVLDLLIPPEELDVNVHPAKSQVKFQKADEVFRLIESSLREELAKAPWQMATQKQWQMATQPQPMIATESKSQTVYQQTGLGSNSDLKDPYFTATHTNNWSSLREGHPHMLALRSQPSHYNVSRKTIRTEPSAACDKSLAPNIAEANSLQDIGASQRFWQNLEIIGQYGMTFILAQDGADLVMIDQHAAHERVLYERFQAALQNSKVKQGHLESQRLLIPIEIKSQALPEDVASSWLTQLDELGFDLDYAGLATWWLRAHPAMITAEAAVKALETALAEMLELGGTDSIEQVFNNALATMACHSAIRAGDTLDASGIRKLLSEMDESPFSGFCPHGRPVSVRYKFSQFETDFGRRV